MYCYIHWLIKVTLPVFSNMYMYMYVECGVQHGPVVKADSTHAGSPGLIPGGGKEQNGRLALAT